MTGTIVAPSPFYHVTITRSYKTSDVKWQRADSFSLNDLEAVSVILRHANVWITEKRCR